MKCGEYNCNRSHQAKGLCQLHYRRWLYTGTTELLPRSGNNRSTHRMSHSPEYKAYCDAKRRCNDVKSKDYPNYGGRGIKVSKAWSTFEEFIKDVGLRPSPYHSLDRIDNNGDYAPNNVRWSPRSLQGLNKRVTAKSGVSGVYKSPSGGAWLARISVDNRLIHLGTFNTFDEAVRCRKQAERERIHSLLSH